MYQLNILDLAVNDNESILEGPFVTNRTKEFNVLTSYIRIKKENQLSNSYLMQYLQSNSKENTLIVAK